MYAYYVQIEIKNASNTAKIRLFRDSTSIKWQCDANEHRISKWNLMIYDSNYRHECGEPKCVK